MKNYLKIVFVLLLALNIGLILINLNQRNEIRQLISKNKYYLNSKNIIEKDIIKQVSIDVNNNNRDLTLDKDKFSSNNNNDICFQNKTNKLILRIPSSSCSKCSEHSIALIDTLSGFEKNQKYILTSFDDVRNFETFKHTFRDVAINKLNLSRVLDLGIEKYSCPYFFIINN